MSGIVWIASYPKSGNTWMRLVLAHLVGEDRAAFGINNFGRHLNDSLGIASERHAFDQFSGLDASELLPDEIDILRPRVYEAIAARATRQMFVKIHDAYLPTPADEPLVPLSATRAVLYIVRNPLDVAVSLAFHEAVDFDAAIAQMADPAFAFSNSAARLPQQLRQRLSTWSGHVESWIDAPGLERCVVRYEDMVAAPRETFSRVVRFLGLPSAETHLPAALGAASFERLRDEEAREGFVEKPRRAEQFFREGRVGGWRAYLSDAQAKRILENHRDVMRRLDYLDCDGGPRY
jgi:aryl sulfotransferase